MLGSGPIGLGVAAALLAQGNKTVAVVDRDEHRPRCAKKIGAHPILSESNDLEQMKDALEAYFGVMPNTNHRVYFSDAGVEARKNAMLDVDAVFDCIGIPNFVDEFLLHAKQYSRLCTIAVHRAPTPIRFHEVMSTQCALMGSRGYEPEDIEEGIGHLAAKRSAAPLMVSHCLPLAQTPEAFAYASDPTQAVKVVLNME